MPTPDFFTPLFPSLNAHFHSATGRRSPSDSPPPLLHQLQLLFATWIPASWTQPTPQGAGSRRRLWDLELTFWTFLSQVFALGACCRAAVREAQLHCRLQQRLIPKDDTAAYCLARLRLPLDRLGQLVQDIASRMLQRVPDDLRWRGHVVKVLDGTTFTADDTPANQQGFPQPRTQAAGCGFPCVRLVAYFCLASGALLGWVSGTYFQSELTLALALLQQLQPGDVLLADRHFGNYRILAHARARGAHVVARLHVSRSVDLRRGTRLGRGDRRQTWTRPRRVGPGFTLHQWLALPQTLDVRLVRFRITEPGFRSESITLVTTLLDPMDYPLGALAALYRRRWQVELSFRQIKTALGLEHLAVRSPAMIHRSLLMHLLAYQLTRALMLDAALCWHQPLDRLSFKGSLDTLTRYAEALRRARSKKARTELVALLQRALADDEVPRRPGRREPRALKRRPKAYARLNCPRHRFKENSSKLRRRAAARRASKRLA